MTQKGVSPAPVATGGGSGDFDQLGGLIDSKDNATGRANQGISVSPLRAGAAA